MQGQLEYCFENELTNLPKEINQFCMIDNLVFISSVSGIIIYKNKEILEKRPGKHSLFQMDDRVIMISLESEYLRAAIYTEAGECHKARIVLTEHVSIDLYETWIQGAISTNNKFIINQIRYNPILCRYESLIWTYNVDADKSFCFDHFTITRPKFLFYDSKFNYVLENYEKCVYAFKHCRVKHHKNKLQFNLSDCQFQRDSENIKCIEYHHNIISYLEKEHLVWIFPYKQRIIKMNCGDPPLFKIVTTDKIYILYHDGVCVCKINLNILNE